MCTIPLDAVAEAVRISFAGRTMTDSTTNPYAIIGAVILLAVTASLAFLIVATAFGPKKRHGVTKDSTYESGMPVVHDARRRFHIRFYIVAMLFLLFDVEVVFLWPWALVFNASAADGYVIPLDSGAMVGKGFLLAGMAVFFSILVLGLVYEWLKGAFKWD